MDKKYSVGMIIKGHVTGIEKYGIFVNIDEEYNGLVHISEVSDDFVRNVEDYVEIGEMIYVKVIGVDHDSHQLKLSIKNINYRITSSISSISESISGFSPLADALDGWILEKAQEIKSLSASDK